MPMRVRRDTPLQKHSMIVEVLRYSSAIFAGRFRIGQWVIPRKLTGAQGSRCLECQKTPRSIRVIRNDAEPR